MSRIGNKHIVIPAGVEVTINEATVTVKGPKGELTKTFEKCIEIKNERGIKGYVTSGVHFAIAELKKKYTEETK